MNKQRGFTLLELLVVIAIIAVVVAFAVSNFVGARQRARDVRKKAEISQMKSALRLYYNDFNIYPGSAAVTSENTFDGCGGLIPPSTACTGSFTAGTTVYMKLLPPASDYVWSYRQVAGGDDFCLWSTLDNTADAEIAKSQTKCNTPTICSSFSPPVPADAYVVCAD